MVLNKILRFWDTLRPDTDPEKVIREIKKNIKPEDQDTALREASYVHEALVSWVKPKVWQIETTSHCGGKCVMCPKTYSFEREKTHMPLELFKHIIDQINPDSQLQKNGIPVIQLFHYGSPSLYPHFYDSIVYCKEKGYHVTISEIASLPTRERIREAVESGLDEIWMIVDGMDDETFKKIRGNGVSFDKSVENIKYMVELKASLHKTKPEIQVIMIRQPYNAHQWQAFLDYWGKFEGVKSFVAYLSNFKGDVPEINNLLKELQKNNGQPEEDKRIKYIGKYRCYYPWHSVSIMADGRVVPCCRDMNGTYVLGDLREKSLEEIWNDKPMQALRAEWISGKITNKLCRNCTEANNEIGLPYTVYDGFRRITAKDPKQYVVRG